MQEIITSDVAVIVKAFTELRYDRHAVEPEKWSQRAFAERLGWTQPQLSRYETGAKIPGPTNLQRWAVGLGVDFTVTATITYAVAARDAS